MTPRYHITAERNWMNDPNGPIHWEGRYHLFFQTNPAAPVWGRPHWGHVSSDDLVHWTRHPLALSPHDDGPDRDGCWSGCTRDIDGVPTIFYTGVVGEGDNREESVCRALGTPDLSRWTKDAANPIIAGPPHELGSGYHRDPFVWRDGDQWRMILGSGLPDGERTRGAVLEYRSDDLDTWRYAGVLFADPDPGPHAGQLWECPQLLAIDGQTFLIVSIQDPDHAEPMRSVSVYCGDLDGGRFVARSRQVLDGGDMLYAPAVCRDDRDRWLLWGWIRDQPPATPPAKVGALTLPRVLSLRSGGLTMTPASELEALRREGIPLSRADGAGPVPPQLEVVLELRRGFGRAEVTLTPDGGPGAMRVWVDHATLAVDGAASGQPLRRKIDVIDEPLRLRVFVDGPVVEVFAAGCSITTRRSATWPGIALSYDIEHPAALTGARAWQLSDDVIGSHRVRR